MCLGVLPSPSPTESKGAPLPIPVGLGFLGTSVLLQSWGELIPIRGKWVRKRLQLWARFFFYSPVMIFRGTRRFPALPGAAGSGMSGMGWGERGQHFPSDPRDYNSAPRTWNLTRAFGMAVSGICLRSL